MKSFMIGVLIVTSTAFAVEPISNAGFRWIMANDAMSACDQIFNASGRKAGKVFVDLQLDPSGQVLSATSNEKKTTIQNEKLVACVTNSIKGYSYPMEVSGKQRSVFVVIPFPRHEEAASKKPAKFKRPECQAAGGVPANGCEINE